MFLGIDLGTSGVKIVLVDERQKIIGQANQPLESSSPAPLWSEQDPAAWWRATNDAMHNLKNSYATQMRAVRAIGLSGQMHGATLLDSADRVLRPCILWNDARAGAQCRILEEREPDARAITGNMAMPGFTAPKLLWVAEHEPDFFQRIKKILLPKDYLRLLMIGEHVSEMSDASGTLWLDVASRRWSEAMLAATGLDLSAMPRLVEGSEATGMVRKAIARDWGLGEHVVVAGGAGDNAAGAVGIATVVPGRAFLSLGTSGVFFAANAEFTPNPDRAVHAFCHCLPNTWHQMSVILSAASCLAWLSRVTGAQTEATLIAELESRESSQGPDRDRPLFLPYLTGERTPHNDPAAKAVFFGLTPQTSRPDLTRAVLEGVAFAFRDGQQALYEAGAKIDHVSVIGGGARARIWGRILASVLGRNLTYHEDGDVGPAFGAARLARLSVTHETQADICIAPPVDHVVEPDPAASAELAERYASWSRLYRDLRGLFEDA